MNSSKFCVFKAQKWINRNIISRSLERESLPMESVWLFHKSTFGSPLCKKATLSEGICLKYWAVFIMYVGWQGSPLRFVSRSQPLFSARVIGVFCFPHTGARVFPTAVFLKPGKWEYNSSGVLKIFIKTFLFLKFSFFFLRLIRLFLSSSSSKTEGFHMYFEILVFRKCKRHLY